MNCADEIKNEYKCMDEIKSNGELLSKNKNDAK